MAIQPLNAINLYSSPLQFNGVRNKTVGKLLNVLNLTSGKKAGDQGGGFKLEHIATIENSTYIYFIWRRKQKRRKLTMEEVGDLHNLKTCLEL